MKITNAYTEVVTGRVTGVKASTIYVRSDGIEPREGSFTVQPLPPCRIDDHVCVILYGQKILAISNFSTASAETYRVMAPDGPYKKWLVSKEMVVMGITLLSVFSALFAYAVQICSRTGEWYAQGVLVMLCACIFSWILICINESPVAWNSKIDAEIQRAIINAAANAAIWEKL
jgi:hypothetical protein